MLAAVAASGKISLSFSGLAGACYTDGGESHTATRPGKGGYTVTSGNGNAYFLTSTDGNMTSYAIIQTCGGAYICGDYYAFRASVILERGTAYLYVDIGYIYSCTTYFVCFGGDEAPVTTQHNSTSVQIIYHGGSNTTMSGA